MTAPGKQNETPEMIHEPISNSMTISNEAVDAATPRTDAVAGDGWSGDAECVSADFARGLERELSAITRVCAERDEEIEAWKQNGLNAVAGKDREILALSAQLAEMKDALETIAYKDNRMADRELRRIARAALSSFPAAATEEERCTCWLPDGNMDLCPVHRKKEPHPEPVESRGQNELNEKVNELIAKYEWDRNDLYDTSEHQIVFWHNEKLREFADELMEALCTQKC